MALILFFSAYLSFSYLFPGTICLPYTNDGSEIVFLLQVCISHKVEEQNIILKKIVH